MYIFLIMLKMMLKNYRRLFLSAVFLIIFCTSIGFIANSLLYNKKLIEPFTIAVVDYDKTFETEVLLKTIKSLDYIKSIVTIIDMSEDSAKDALKNDNIASYIIIPQGFTKNVRTGINLPIDVIYNPSNKIQTLIIQLFIESGISYLSAMQSGVYAVYDYSHAIIEENEFKKMILDINFEYLSIILNREEILIHNTISISGDISIFTHYLLTTLIFFTILNVMLNADIIYQFLNSNMIKKMKLAGIKTSSLVISITFINFILNLLYNFIIWTILFTIFKIKIMLSINNILGILLFFLCLSIYATIMIIIIKDIRQLGLINFVISLIGLFLVGGIIPSAYLPQAINDISVLTMNHWGNLIIKNLVR